MTSTIRIAARNLARSPGFTTLAAMTLGLGIGMSVAVWSVVDAVLVDSLPYPDADRLVQVQMTEPARGHEGYPMSGLDYLDYARRNHSFAALAATFRENLNLTGQAAPERVSGTWVSAQFFTVMGVAPRLGRSFRTTDDTPGWDGVAVISHGLWQRRFDGTLDVLGRTVTVNGRVHTIVGVTPEGFAYPSGSDLWLPIAIDPATESRHHGWVVPIGRLRGEVSLQAARADLAAIAEQLRRDHPDSNAGRGVAVVPLKETIVGVVADVRHHDLAAAAGPEMYIPVAQLPFEWATFVVRARSGSATALANPVADAIRRLDPDLPVFNVQTMTEVVRGSVAGTRVVTSLLVLFAGAGLALAGVGVFAVVSYSVGHRVHEVAVRMSLGGTPDRIVALVVRQGLAPVAAGLVLGAAGALALMRLLASHLYGVAPHDLATFTATAALVLAIAALATWLPARRAARVEPMTVLRSE